MRFLQDKFFQFCFHDTQVNQIYVVDDGVNLIFNDGIYETNELGQEIELTSKVVLKIKISRFDKNSEYEYILVNAKRKRKIKEISLKDFIERLCYSSYDIDQTYFSDFNGSMLFKGYCGQEQIELDITNICDVIFDFYT